MDKTSVISDLESIVGVQIKPLKTFPDDRGFFRELIRENDPFFEEGFKQWSHSKMAKNTVKAWHFHHKQVDWWYLGLGFAEAVLFDNRPKSDSFGKKVSVFIGDKDEDTRAEQIVIKIPQGVLHGLKVHSEFAHLFYITSEIYNPEDEGRLPFNSEVVGHDWGDESELIVAENDRKIFTPPHPIKAPTN